jgi:hypothetical protein
MSASIQDEDPFWEILTNGTYYPEASHHYPDHGPSVSVICDKCRRPNLKRCIGFKELDLCLACASVVGRSFDLPHPSDFTAPRPVYAPTEPQDPKMITFMAPSSYTAPDPGWRRLGPVPSSRGPRHLVRMAPYGGRRTTPSDPEC